jgi:capsular exopolysaccharide synthesis family protein
MKSTERPYMPPAAHHVADEKHVMDYVRVIYRRRWIAIPVFLALFTIGAVNALRQIPIYQGRAQMLIEKDTPNVATLDQMFQSQDGWMNDEFYQTQYRILQSRSLAKRTIDSMKLWDAPRLGNGPEPKATLSVTGLFWQGINSVITLAGTPFKSAEEKPAAPAVAVRSEPRPEGETPAQSGLIDEFLGGLSVVPVRNSRIVEIRYTSSDPEFAAHAANALAKAYIQQSLELRFNTSKEAADWLSERLAEQRKAVETSEAALQAFREKNGAVAAADGASNIVIARLTDLNAALTKAKTDRINKEALYNQLKSAEGRGAIDTVPTILANEYIQKLKSELADLQRQQAQLAERYGERHAEMIKVRTALETADAKLKVETSKVVESVRNEYQTALNEEHSLQGALDAQKGEALSMNRKGIEASVLQREVESNRQIYESLLQRTKDADISSERKSTNVRIVDEAVVPRSPISPNVRRDLTVSFGLSFLFAIGLGFLFEQLDNRIKTPAELKSSVGVPFLGMVPTISREKGTGDPLVSGDVAANFAEAFKSIRTNVLFSSAEEGMRSVVVTSAGPGEGKSVVSANIAVSLAQTGQRVLLVDADMRRPRIHEIFGGEQEPGLSNVLVGTMKPSDVIKRARIPSLWVLPAGHIPPNPAELLGSRKFLEFMLTLETHFDWVVIDTPPVLVVADSSIVANQASGVVFVVSADKTPRAAAKAAVVQLESANAKVIGSVLNRVDLVRNPYYYQSYYRKEYARYYVKQQ